MTTTILAPSSPFTTSDLQRWHPSELAIQEKRGFADDVFDGPGGTSAGLIHGSESFLRQLRLMPLTTLDAEGRPWVSLLTSPDGEAGFISSLCGEGQEEAGMLRFRTYLPAGTPLRQHVKSGKRLKVDPASQGQDPERMLAAGVGVLLHNRRRNKYDGWIASAEPASDGDGDRNGRGIASTSASAAAADVWTIDMVVTASVGNCPKLTTAIASADTIFLGTLHTGTAGATWYTDRSKVGCNIRGGRRGFLRQYWDSQRGRHCILLPDFSGNRWLQSLGNIVGDPVAGMAIPVFDTGDVVYLTCDAEVLSGDDATRVMRGFQGLVKMWVTGYVYVRGALPFETGRDDATTSSVPGWSPYNPPVRKAVNESDAVGVTAETAPPEATLHDIIDYNDNGDVDAAAAARPPTLLTFIWHLPQTHAHLLSSYTPGQHLVVDAFDLLDTRVKLYAHMAQFPGGEHELNDDGTRSWTISAVRCGGQYIETTLRRVQRGGVTPNLFNMGARAVGAAKAEAGDACGDGRGDHTAHLPSWTPRLKVLGVAGNFTLPDAPSRLLYICSGIGITPLLAHLAGIRAITTPPMALIAIVAVRDDELDAVMRMIRRSIGVARGEEGVPLKIELRVHLLLRGDRDDPQQQQQPRPRVCSIFDDGDAQAHAQIWPGARLTSASLSTQGPDGEGSPRDDETSTNTFHLPLDDLDVMAPPSSTPPASPRRFYLCGSAAFQETARRAILASDRLAVKDHAEIVEERFTY